MVSSFFIKILKKNFSKEFNLRGLRIVIDCANGAGYKSAPKILSDLGAKVISFGVNPNGLNINWKCGSTYPYKIQSNVKKYNANIGIALDGDADRIIMCDEKSKIIDGDQIIAMIAKRWKRKKFLKEFYMEVEDYENEVKSFGGSLEKLYHHCVLKYGKKIKIARRKKKL